MVVVRAMISNFICGSIYGWCDGGRDFGWNFVYIRMIRDLNA